MGLIRAYPVAALLVLLAMGISGRPAGVRGATCGTPVAVLGADLSAAGRAEVARTLGLQPGIPRLVESLADERVQAHGLIPAPLLGKVAVSSVILRPLPPGSGLRVSQNGNVTLYPAEAYASALLTAGVTDADAIIAAPESQRALGTTALLGLLRAATVSCAAVNPARHDLAIREFALTNALTDAMSATEAARLLAATKVAAVAARRAGGPDLATVLAEESTKLHVTVPAGLRAPLLAYLGDLARGHLYDAVVAARPLFGGVPPLQATVLFARPGSAPLPYPGVVHGTLVSADAGRVSVRQRDGVHRYPLAPDVQVYRDGSAAGIGALRPGDAVTATISGDRHAATISASGVPGPARAGVGAPGNPDNPSGEMLYRGTALAATPGGLSLQLPTGPRTFGLVPGLRVTRDGRPATLGQIRPGDSLTIATDPAGAATRVDALSHPAAAATASPAPAPPVATAVPPAGQGAVVHGTVASVAGAALSVRTGGGLRDYRPAPAARITRDGLPATLAQLRPGDSVTVAIDASGRATRMEATSAATSDRRPLIAVVPVLLAALGLLLLLLARRRRRRVITTSAVVTTRAEGAAVEHALATPPTEDLLEEDDPTKLGR